MNLINLQTKDLLKLQSEVMRELRSRGILRTMNNPVGDYAEWLVASALGLKLAKNSAAGHDAESETGKKIQIKARRVNPANKSRQLGVIRNLEKGDFDELIAIIFSESYEVVEAVSIPHSVISEYSTHRSHVNGHVLHLRGALLSDSRVRDIRAELSQEISQQPQKAGVISK
ncbi:hypothetical protein IB254_01955 [Pseudomonas sp. PDM03]|uniref:DUF6998 domain-containing protein n=1 Tax=Pseudomonas sp. PDM03 TaxID=2769266 RepID=UPI0017841F83|nr:hypothetical protein [Pseudomonas sp. PDM03]MBD9585809.1 hypothetical protein [Pseudomonas sp. PDM03]